MSGQEKIILVADKDFVTISRANDNMKRIGAETCPFYWVDPNFKDWGLNRYREVTSTTPVAVYTAKSGTMGQIFADPDNCTVSQRDIVEFRVKYFKLLGQNGMPTKFLIKENDNFFVVSIGVFDFGVRVFLQRLDLGQVIDQEIRVVLPLGALRYQSEG